MTYKKLYNIIVNETKKGETDIIDKWVLQGIPKTEIIDIIDYISSFIETEMFENMQYWFDYSYQKDIDKIKNQRILEKEILEILLNKQKREIEQKNKTIEQLNYYLHLVL